MNGAGKDIAGIALHRRRRDAPHLATLPGFVDSRLTALLNCRW